jgi:PBSX family phage terminase large subunit
MYQSFSEKQQLAYVWWRLDEFAEFKRCIWNGAIRTGKTDIGLSRSFIDWAFDVINNSEIKVKGWNRFFITGYTKTNIEETVVDPLIDYCNKKGYYTHSNKTTGYIYIKRIKNGESQTVIIRYFGMDNSVAFKRAQGLTYRGGAIDEAGLISIKSIETLEGRCITFKDYKIFMTTNPEGDQTHEFYTHYIKGGYNKGTLISTFELLDNPLFTQADEDYYKKVFTPTMFQRKIKGRWVRAEGAIYKKFDIKHIQKVLKNFKKEDYMRYTIGVDYGETDPTVFTFEGMRKNYSGLDIIKTYFHKNSEYDDKAIDDYLNDFVEFALECYELARAPIYVYTEINLYRLLRKDNRLRGKCIINKAIKKPEYENKKAIQERINITNMMFGANYLRIDEACVELISSLNNTPYDKNGVRLDNATTQVDPLDSMEYGFIPSMTQIRNYIMREVRK